jgi:rSAM/selenodomain-associated transferase 2
MNYQHPHESRKAQYGENQVHAIEANDAVSVVIPALNEAEALPGNLRALVADDTIHEVIVVDGGSTDGTVGLVADTPGVMLLHSHAGRGRQMNAGARAASGDWLLFHHADTRLPAQAGTLLAAMDRSVRWGGFQHRFSEANWKLNLISRLHNFRCRQTGVIYGDQSMFVRRNFFFQAGAFPEEGLEDLKFSDKALTLAPSRLLDAEVVTDSRKFRQIGEVRALAHVLSIIRRYEKNRKLDNERFFQNYR